MHTMTAIHVAFVLSDESDFSIATTARAEIQVIATTASQIKKRTVFGSMVCFFCLTLKLSDTCAWRESCPNEVRKKHDS